MLNIGKRFASVLLFHFVMVLNKQTASCVTNCNYNCSTHTRLEVGISIEAVTAQLSRLRLKRKEQLTFHIHCTKL